MTATSDQTPIYLDNAATTPVDPKVREAMRPFLEEQFGNPSSKHRMGVRAADALDEAREHLAKATGAEAKRIHFTAGGTEANNLAVQGFARAGKKHGRHIVVGPTEHSSVGDAALAMRDDGFEVEFMRLDESGDLDLDHAASLLREDTTLVTQMVASNEFGTVYPIRRLADLVRERAPRAVLHVDGVQALGKLDVDLSELGADSIAVSAHKIHAPKGTGALVLERDLPLRPLFFGGGQEGKVRPGTQNPAGIVGFGEAIRLCELDRAAACQRMAKLRDRLAEGLAQQAGVRILKPGSSFLPTILSVLMPGVPSEVRLHHLDANGVMASAGAACQADAKDVNPALLALGLNADQARSVLRFSFGRFTTDEQVTEALQIVSRVSEELSALSS